MEETITEIDNIKADLNYEQLLGRAIDRVLYHKATSQLKLYTTSVQSLYLALVDLEGKPLRAEMEKIVKDMGFRWEQGLAPDDIVKHDVVFQEIIRTLANHKMLFKSTPIEVNR